MSAWHPPDANLRAWVAGTIGALEAASVEQHMPVCEMCREVVSGTGAVRQLEAVWQSIRERIEPQPLNLVGRALVGLGMSRGNAFLVSSAPSLSTAWVLGVTLALVFAVAAAATSETRGVAIFLLVAPLAPVAGIAFAFSGDNDPLFELTLAAPYSKFRLLLWRSAAVLATTIPLTVIAALLVDASWWVAGVWLVPALAFSAVTLAVARWVDPQLTGTAIALGWVFVQSFAGIRGMSLVVFSTEALVLYCVVGVVATVAFALMRRTEAFFWRIP